MSSSESDSSAVSGDEIERQPASSAQTPRTGRIDLDTNAQEAWADLEIVAIEAEMNRVEKEEKKARKKARAERRAAKAERKAQKESKKKKKKKEKKSSSKRKSDSEEKEDSVTASLLAELKGQDVKNMDEKTLQALHAMNIVESLSALHDMQRKRGENPSRESEAALNQALLALDQFTGLGIGAPMSSTTGGTTADADEPEGDGSEAPPLPVPPATAFSSSLQSSALPPLPPPDDDAGKGTIFVTKEDLDVANMARSSAIISYDIESKKAQVMSTRAPKQQARLASSSSSGKSIGPTLITEMPKDFKTSPTIKAEPSPLPPALLSKVVKGDVASITWDKGDRAKKKKLKKSPSKDPNKKPTVRRKKKKPKAILVSSGATAGDDGPIAPALRVPSGLGTPRVVGGVRWGQNEVKAVEARPKDPAGEHSEAEYSSGDESSGDEDSDLFPVLRTGSEDSSADELQTGPLSPQLPSETASHQSPLLSPLSSPLRAPKTSGSKSDGEDMPPPPPPNEPTHMPIASSVSLSGATGLWGILSGRRAASASPMRTSSPGRSSASGGSISASPIRGKTSVRSKKSLRKGKGDDSDSDEDLSMRDAGESELSVTIGQDADGKKVKKKIKGLTKSRRIVRTASASRLVVGKKVGRRSSIGGGSTARGRNAVGTIPGPRRSVSTANLLSGSVGTIPGPKRSAGSSANLASASPVRRRTASSASNLRAGLRDTKSKKASGNSSGSRLKDGIGKTTTIKKKRRAKSPVSTSLSGNRSSGQSASHTPRSNSPSFPSALAADSGMLEALGNIHLSDDDGDLIGDGEAKLVDELMVANHMISLESAASSTARNKSNLFLKDTNSAAHGCTVAPLTKDSSMRAFSFQVIAGLAGAQNVSLRSCLQPQCVLYHSQGRLKVGKIQAGAAWQNDASFSVVYGLCGEPHSISLESCRKPGTYVRQQGGDVYVMRRDSEKTGKLRGVFDKDASFFARPALAGADFDMPAMQAPGTGLDSDSD